MYCYKLNNSYTTYVSYAYINDCIKASEKKASSPINKKGVNYIIINTKNTVKIGTEVSVVDLDTKEEDTFIITYSRNVFKKETYISIESPIGNALLGHQINDVVTIKIPTGILRYKITNVIN